MYLDRTPPEPLVALLEEPLAWLVEFARDTDKAVLEFRKARGSPACVQLYVGRTSPLKVQVRRGGKFEVTAGEDLYRSAFKALAENEGRILLDVQQFARRAGELRATVEQAVAKAPPDFTDGEAVAQAGMLRRYGIRATKGDSFVALDSEVAIGFRSKRERMQLQSALRSDLGLADNHKELDVLGLLEDGSIALVELKAAGGDMQTAAAQAATHAYLFRRLAEHWSPSSLRTLARAKQRIGLLGHVPEIAEPVRFVPVVAAPGLPLDWRPKGMKGLEGLQLWRLSGKPGTAGEITEKTQVG